MGLRLVRQGEPAHIPVIIGSLQGRFVAYGDRVSNIFLWNEAVHVEIGRGHQARHLPWDMAAAQVIADKVDKLCDRERVVGLWEWQDKGHGSDCTFLPGPYGRSLGGANICPFPRSALVREISVNVHYDVQWHARLEFTREAAMSLIQAKAIAYALFEVCDTDEDARERDILIHSCQPPV
jgi:hypothetical protein